jgi:hypothetical protein
VQLLQLGSDVYKENVIYLVLYLIMVVDVWDVHFLIVVDLLFAILI